ncbi:polysaccharide biosynthesis protein [Iocasia frigidifontis]|uniref:Polysaccharide biosynthesis protein n=1 Tax=Iocasia fonsfrigidae TaxID=2682810 RepID=A0A8A7KC41_9FIRM|nr:N-acetylneuraminate synthase family protein [Iocasia fonsfrigidae]QTL96939.1 polysaccharide biosynthesis protein [Iocasia fonsfrigidae]
MKKITIGNRNIGDGEPAFIIAEAGSNHNGDINLAKELIDIAVNAKVDAIKFQTFTGETLFKENLEAQKIVEKYKLPLEWHKELKDYAENNDIIFMTTPFYPEAVGMAEKLNIDAYKIASGDLTYYSLLELIAEKRKPIILSTGISNLFEVEKAVEKIYSRGNEEIILLHCVSNYPTDPKNVNLKVISTLKNKFNIPVGFSDHTMGIEVSIAAIAMGANVIEKHFTISRDMEGMDHFYALEPDELKNMVDGIRKIELAMGHGQKEPAEEEIPEVYFARRGIYAAKNIKKDDRISFKDLKFVRPVDGINAQYYKIVIGKIASKDIKMNQAINWNLLK